MKKKKTLTLNRDALKKCYDELCCARKPKVRYELDDDYGMARQAIFAMSKAINGITNFLYNSGIEYNR